MITPEDIANYYRHNKLADSIHRMSGIKEREDKKAFKHHAVLSERIAEAEREMEDIGRDMEKRLGPQWAARVVEYIVSQAGVFQVMSRSAASGHHELVDTDRVIIGEGCHAYEIRRAVRGMDE